MYTSDDRLYEILINNEEVKRLETKIHTFGRGVDCDIRLDDPTASKVHATLDLCDGKGFLTDGDMLLNRPSKNGVFVNGKRLDPQHGVELKKGDVIQFTAKCNIIFCGLIDDEGLPDTTASQ
jgi:pSer/pThr/pTyr-binding forkhead associated (FHA) protein